MSFEICTPIWPHVNENEKKIRVKILKNQTKKKMFADIVDSVSQNLPLIRLTVSEKPSLRTDDGRRTTTASVLYSSTKQS